MSFSANVTRWDQYTVPDAAADGVNPNLVRAIMTAESSGNPNAVSNTGAQGLMQLEPSTAAGLGVTNAFDPAQNIAGGVKYLQQLLARFGNQDLAIAAYNAGPNAVAAAGGVPNYPETQAYVKNVDALLAMSGSSTSTSTPGPVSATSTPSGTDPNPNDNPLQKWIYEHTPAGSIEAGVNDPVGALAHGLNPSAGADPLGLGTLMSTAQQLAAEAFIGAVFLAIIAGGFAIAAQPEG